MKHLAAEEDAEPEYYIVMEASYTIDENDLVRATDNAKIIRHVTGRPAYPVVTGVRLRDGLDDDMQQKITTMSNSSSTPLGRKPPTGTGSTRKT